MNETIATLEQKQLIVRTVAGEKRRTLHISLTPEGTQLLKTCGGLFDFLSGLRSRAPQALQAAGLEWAYRMALEPKRLGWRYATTNVTAAMAMARGSQRGH